MFHLRSCGSSCQLLHRSYVVGIEVAYKLGSGGHKAASVGEYISLSY